MDIFPNSGKRQQQERSAVRLLASRAGRLLNDIAHLSTRRRMQMPAIRRKLADLLELSRKRGQTVLSRKLATALKNLSGTTETRHAQAVIDDVLKIAGPLGQALKDAARQPAPEPALMKELKAELARAERIVAAMEGKIPPREAGAKRVNIEKEPYRPVSGAPMPYNTRLLPDGKHVRIQTGTFDKTYSLDHPAVTGAMVNVKSSNVHSIGFRINYKHPLKSILLVRYLHWEPGVKQRSGGGPTYEYYDVHPDLFDHFLKASSKGKFVWDELRVRGSRVEHQYRYNLKSVVGAYLPRRATVRNGKEMFVRRRGQTRDKQGRIRTAVSQLPNQVLGDARPRSARPNRGKL